MAAAAAKGSPAAYGVIPSAKGSGTLHHEYLTRLAELDAREAQLAEREAKLAAREAKLTQRTVALAKERRKLVQAQNAHGNSPSAGSTDGRIALNNGSASPTGSSASSTSRTSALSSTRGGAGPSATRPQLKRKESPVSLVSPAGKRSHGSDDEEWSVLGALKRTVNRALGSPASNPASPRRAAGGRSNETVPATTAHKPAALSTATRATPAKPSAAPTARGASTKASSVARAARPSRTSASGVAARFQEKLAASSATRSQAMEQAKQSRLEEAEKAAQSVADTREQAAKQKEEEIKEEAEAPKFGLDAETSALVEAKRDIGLEAAVLQWITKVVGTDDMDVVRHFDGVDLSEAGLKARDAAGESNLVYTALKNGVLLCKLAEALRKGCVGNFTRKPQWAMQERENLTFYIMACKTVFGLRGEETFNVSDLVEGKFLGAAVNNVRALHREVRARGYPGPRLVEPNSRRAPIRTPSRILADAVARGKAGANASVNKCARCGAGSAALEISVGDRHYHKQCWKCYKCSAALPLDHATDVGKGVLHCDTCVAKAAAAAKLTGGLAKLGMPPANQYDSVVSVQEAAAAGTATGKHPASPAGSKVVRVSMGATAQRQLTARLPAQSGAAGAQQALLKWAQRKIARRAGYEAGGVRVTNFTTSWRDGRAFAAVLEAGFPGLIDWSQVERKRREDVLEYVFGKGESVGVPRLLDVEDFAGPVPDRKSIVVYLVEMHRIIEGGGWMGNKSEGTGTKLK